MKWQALLPLLLLGACTLRPAFIPPPQRAFAHFQALPRPARDLAVGALWIEGHGAYGAGATSDNLEALPGISGVTVDNDLAASLSLGFLQYLNLDPSLQSKVMVRLNEVTLVHVKDLAKLEGPTEQPRIYEALRVGSATITTTNDIGVAIEARAAEQGLPVFGRGTSGQRSTFSIEAKDVYLAVHIATSRVARSAAVRVTLGAKPQSLRLHGLIVQMAGDGSACEKGQISVLKGSGVVAGPAKFEPHKPIDLKLSAPVGDGAALFDTISIEPEFDQHRRCAVRVALEGTELISQH